MNQRCRAVQEGNAEEDAQNSGQETRQQIDSLVSRPLFTIMRAVKPRFKAMGNRLASTSVARDESVTRIGGHELQYQIRQGSANGTTKRTSQSFEGKIQMELL